MAKFYFTFGQDHAHAVGGYTYDKDVVVSIEAENSEAARAIMFETFGRKWSNQYTEFPGLELFPRGVRPLNYEPSHLLEEACHEFFAHPLGMTVLAVAVVNKLTRDWAAYIGGVPGLNHGAEWRKVAAEGDKLDRRIAAIIWPRLDQRYLWRD